MNATLMNHAPVWLRGWLDLIIPAAEMALILLVAWSTQWLVRRLIRRLSTQTSLPAELAIAARRIIGTVIYSAAGLAILDRFGVSSTVLWTAFTGFAAVGAVAFFAAWSVLSNIFCTILILTTRPFRLHDHIEVLEGGDKPGLRGRVIDVNLIYTTLQEAGEGDNASVLQIPNNLFFQRTIRRWREPNLPPPPPAP